MKPIHLAAPILLYTFLASAWPWPPSFLSSNRGLEKRQDDDGPKSASKPQLSEAVQLIKGEGTATQDRPTRTGTAKASASKTGSSAEASETGKASGTAEASETGKASGTAEASETGKASGTAEPSKTGEDGSKTTKPPKTTDIDVNDPVGGISMLTPAQSSSTYFKIGDDVTLVWNYTDLKVTPSHVNVMASNTATSLMIKANQSVKETNTVVWKTDQYKQNELTMDKYTLIIYDSEKDRQAAGEPGHLAPNAQHTLAMYLPHLQDENTPRKLSRSR